MTVEHRPGAAEAVAHEPLHGRVETDGEEHRDDDQEDDPADREQQAAQPVRRQRPDAEEEAERHRTVVVPQVRWRVGLLRRGADRTGHSVPASLPRGSGESAKPATTSRRAPSWATIASRRLV